MERLHLNVKSVELLAQLLPLQGECIMEVLHALNQMKSQDILENNVIQTEISIQKTCVPELDENLLDDFDNKFILLIGRKLSRD